MQAQTLYEKLWSSHVVHVEDDGTALIYIDRHLVHEVTSPQAFEGLKLAGRKPWRVDSIVATADHNTPTDHWDKGIQDPVLQQQNQRLGVGQAAGIEQQFVGLINDELLFGHQDPAIGFLFLLVLLHDVVSNHQEQQGPDG